MEKWSGVRKGGHRQLAVGSKQKNDDRQVRVRRRGRTWWDDEEPGGRMRRRMRRGSGKSADLPYGHWQVRWGQMPLFWQWRGQNGGTQRLLCLLNITWTCLSAAQVHTRALMCRYESTCTQKEAVEESADENDESKEISVCQRGARGKRLAGLGECNSKSAPDHWVIHIAVTQGRHVGLSYSELTAYSGDKFCLYW